MFKYQHDSATNHDCFSRQKPQRDLNGDTDWFRLRKRSRGTAACGFRHSRLSKPRCDLADARPEPVESNQSPRKRNSRQFPQVGSLQAEGDAGGLARFRAG